MDINELEIKLQNLGYKTKRMSSKRIAIVTDKTRWIELARIACTLEARYNNQGDSTSSIGWVEIEKYRVYAKPMSKQGNKSAGVQNELILAEKLNKPIDHLFITSKSKTQYIADVTGCRSVGHDTRNRRKADIIIETKHGDFPISIKKDNAEVWESADKLVGDLMKDTVLKAVSKKKVQMNPYKGVNRLSSAIATRCPEDMAKNVMFGSDILDNGCILFRSFYEHDFTWDEEDSTMQVKVSSLIHDVDEVKGTEHEPWFLFRNDSTRRGSSVPGVRALAITKSRINKKTVLM